MTLHHYANKNAHTNQKTQDTTPSDNATQSETKERPSGQENTEHNTITQARMHTSIKTYDTTPSHNKEATHGQYDTGYDTTRHAELRIFAYLAAWVCRRRSSLCQMSYSSTDSGGTVAGILGRPSWRHAWRSPWRQGKCDTATSDDTTHNRWRRRYHCSMHD